MLILSSISSTLEFLSVINTSIHESSELIFLKNIHFLGEISNNWSSNLVGSNVDKTLESYW